GSDAGTRAIELDAGAHPSELAAFEDSFRRANPGVSVAPVAPGRPVVVQVRNSAGEPVLGATVELLSGAEVRATARTHADGRAMIVVAPDVAGDLEVRAGKSLAGATVPLPADAVDLPVTLDAPTGAEAPAVDVLFLLDATGSLADEIDGLKD